MQLHNDIENFKSAIINTARKTNIRESLIEKDYYILLILNKLNEVIPGLVFRGGTVLSKCYKIIDRFSEDIDLSLDVSHFTKTNKINANKLIIKTCEELNLTISNYDFVKNRVHNKYNCYNIKYQTVLDEERREEPIKLELVFINKTYPCELKELDTLIVENNSENEIYDSLHTTMLVQKLERTLIDKVFALCDYYIDGNTKRQSRHIYDIAHILPNVDIESDNFKALIAEIRAMRKNNKYGYSAQDGVNINELLKEIIKNDVYKEDYINISTPLFNKPYAYEEAIKSLKIIIDKNIF